MARNKGILILDFNDSETPTEFSKQSGQQKFSWESTLTAATDPAFDVPSETLILKDR